MKKTRTTFSSVKDTATNRPKTFYDCKQLNRIKRELGIKSFEEWYKIKRSNVSHLRGGATLLKKYGSMRNMLQTLYPQYNWLPGMFLNRSTEHWTLEEQRRLLDSIANHKPIVTKEDWYQITTADLSKYKANVLIQRRYNGSLYTALKTLYPNYTWLPWKFISASSSSYWNDTSNHRVYLDWLESELSIESKEEWYEVETAIIKEKGGTPLLQQYKHNLFTCLCTVYPEYHWLPWKLKALPSSHWHSLHHQQEFFNWLADKLEIQEMNEWYGVRASIVAENGGQGILNYYGGYLSKAIAAVFPNHSWLSWKFDVYNSKETLQSQREYFNEIGNKLGIKQLSDWYAITLHDIRMERASSILQKHNMSLVKALKSIYPEYPWKIWRFTRVSPGFWDDLDHQRELFDGIGVQLAVDSENLEKWYSCTHTMVAELSLKALHILQHYYQDSLPAALKKLYPHFNWQVWRFRVIPNEFWNELHNDSQFFDWLKEELNISECRDWYQLNSSLLTDKIGNPLSTAEYAKIIIALMKREANYNWEFWKFRQVPQILWRDTNNQRQFLDWLQIELNIQSLEDWYKVRVDEITERGGKGWLQLHGGFLYRLLAEVYPDNAWQPWRFPSRVPEGTLIEHSKFFHDIAQQLNVKDVEDWYKISASQVIAHGGRKILQQYSGSIVGALLTVYPSTNWQVWRFSQVPANYWNDIHNARQYLEWSAQKLCLKSKEDWLFVNWDNFTMLKGRLLLYKYGGLAALLMKVYPEYPWNTFTNNSTPSYFTKTETHLQRVLSNLFPNESFLRNYRGNFLSSTSANITLRKLLWSG